jgi:hypothetical protein
VNVIAISDLPDGQRGAIRWRSPDRTAAQQRKKKSSEDTRGRHDCHSMSLIMRPSARHHQ